MKEFLFALLIAYMIAVAPAAECDYYCGKQPYGFPQWHQISRENGTLTCSVDVLQSYSECKVETAVRLCQHYDFMDFVWCRPK